MCGFVAILDPREGATVEALRPLALERARLVRHRGPDWSGVYADRRAVLAHERLAIVDVLHGAQPLLSPDDQQVLAVNGEIYNHRALRTRFPDYPFRTDSDCEPILALYRAGGPRAVCEALDGMYAFALWDAERGDFLVARDPIGIVPLYQGRDAEGRRWFASELKALHGVCTEIDVFPPGSFLTAAMDAPERWYVPPWRPYDAVERGPTDPAPIREALEAAVHSHLMSDVPYGVLLSGGLDSSLIAAIAAKFAARRVEDDDRTQAWWPRLHTFSIGLPGSPDVAAARTVADALGTAHHAFTYTVQEGLDALSDVVWHGGPSIACSTPTALRWSAAFAGNADPSGRAVLGIHKGS